MVQLDRNFRGDDTGISIGNYLGANSGTNWNATRDRNIHRVYSRCYSRMENYLKYIWILIFAIILFPTAAYANIPIPMIVIALPGMVVCLIPIIAIESWCINKIINIPPWRCIKYTSMANIGSTIIGIPLAWVVYSMAGCGIHHWKAVIFKDFGLSIPDSIELILTPIINAAWLPPDEKHLFWMGPTALLVLLVPFFYASYHIEYYSMRRMIKDVEPIVLKKAIYVANIYSYAFMAIIVIIWLSYEIITNYST